VDRERVEELADLLLDAGRQRKPIQPLSEQHPGLTVDEAYDVQRSIVRRRLAAGHGVVGWKVGLTSRAMQQMLGVDEPDYGAVTSDMLLPDGGQLSAGDLIAPRVEAEIAFVLRHPLQGPDVTALDVRRATLGVAAAIEVIDSRIVDWRITLPDTVADMASSAKIVVSPHVVPLGDFDLRLLGVALYRNGSVQETGAGAAVLGDPLEAVAWCANKLGGLGTTLEAGAIVMPGAMHRAIDVSAGDSCEARFDRLGPVSVHFSA
jgi:2-keto-4-pentenoate hydratase